MDEQVTRLAKRQFCSYTKKLLRSSLTMAKLGIFYFYQIYFVKTFLNATLKTFYNIFAKNRVKYHFIAMATDKGKS